MASIKTSIGRNIGVIDSGMGGLTVLTDLMISLPAEKYYYFADTKYAPYGQQSRDSVEKRMMQIGEYMVQQEVQLLVVACNTATSVAIDALRKKLPIPVIGMEPAIKQAVSTHGCKRVLVAATPLTIQEKKLVQLIQRLQGASEIIPMPCPGLVDIIERQGPAASAIEDVLKDLLKPFMDLTINCIVLGCTHYLLIKEQWKKAAGPATRLIDGNDGTVRQVKRVLGDMRSHSISMNSGTIFDQSGSRVMIYDSASNKENCKKLRHILDQQLQLRQGNRNHLLSI